MILAAIERAGALAVARALLGALKGRGLTVSPEDEERILTTTDDTLLERWCWRAGTCLSVTDLLDN